MSATTRAEGEAASVGDDLMLQDAAAVRRLDERIDARERAGKPAARERRQRDELLVRARERIAVRRAALPRITYPEDLPITSRLEVIGEALAGHPVVVVCGDTGSGKTTQLPKLCLALGRGVRGLVGHTQPRRIAARSVASRIAQELGTEPGGVVSYKVRFAEQESAQSLVRVMTDGILLAEVRHDPDLLRYDTLIIDEAHERSLNIDFLLGYLHRLLPRRPDLRIIITSATIDPARFARFFNDAPVIEVAGRSHPIELRYRPLASDEDDDLDPGLLPGVVAALDELAADRVTARHDVLVFLPGEREIRELGELLAKRLGDAAEITPLFSRLSWQEQQRIFQPARRRRIVLATNVAETSLTVPGIRAVVDSGLARIAHYSPRSKILRLPVEPVSQASAAQRAGRCGRVGPGVCIRLYSEEDFAGRPAFTPPEILRTNLASVILQMAALGLGEVDAFPFVDAPDTRLVSDGYRLLAELEAVDGSRHITPLGRRLAGLPVDPRLARMLVEAHRFGALAEILTLVSVLSIQDPRERPLAAQAQADAAHARFADARSDFTALLNLWNAWQEVRRTRSSSQSRRWAREGYLSAARMREWEELRGQLAGIVAEFDWTPNESPATAEAVHRSLLPGLLGGIGQLDERGEYLGTRGLRFRLAPGTKLRERAPRWLMAATITETGRVLARTVAAIEPQWIETAAHHLVRRSYGEPVWEPERGSVSARETVTLHGLTIASGRHVNYGAVEPAAAREIFVREALVHGRSRLRAGFLVHNAGVRRSLEEEEAKLRRRGVLFEEERLVQACLERVPVAVHDLAGFERWRRGAGREAERLLHFRAEDLRPAGAPRPDPDLYPDRWSVAGHELPLRYRFDPALADDGATLELPLVLLGALAQGDLDWGIPGWRLEKVTGLIRGLPKSLRRSLVPAPDVAARALACITPADGHFHDVLARQLSVIAGTPIAPGELRTVVLPAHLRLHVRVVDADGRVVGEGRDLDELARDLAAARRQSLARAATDFARTGLTRWDFGRLPDSVVVRRGDLLLDLYPALVDEGTSVALELRETAAAAALATRLGVRRLAVLALERELRPVRKAVGADATINLLHQPLGALKRSVDELCDRVVERCCLAEAATLPVDEAGFAELVDGGRADVYATGVRLQGLLRATLEARRAAGAAIAAVPQGLEPDLVADARAQLEALVRPGFVAATPDPWLDRLPLHLRALARRVERLRGAGREQLRLQWEYRQWRSDAAALVARCPEGDAPPEPVQTLRWLIEEFGISLFAQELGTLQAVSTKRLVRQREAALAAIAGRAPAPEA